jgi:hypothetical protein
LNPLLAINLGNVRSFYLEARAITLTIGERSERFVFPSEEQMHAAIEEWLRPEGSDGGFPQLENDRDD